MVISHWVAINKMGLSRDGVLLRNNDDLTAGQLYKDLRCNYPKFYKMDILCKWAFVAAEYLLTDHELLYPGVDLNKIAVVLSTSNGCLDVDKRYFESITIPSPSLFVYTLPNIMLGEICIRHGFKGEQMCLVDRQFDPKELWFITDSIMQNKGMEACLCGWVDVDGDERDICLFWVTTQGEGPGSEASLLEELYSPAV